MKLLGIVALALGILALAGVSSAQTSKPSVVFVSQLQEHCEANARTDTATATNDRSHLKSTDEMASMVCVGYILGTMDSLLDDSSPYYIKSARSVLISAWASAGYIAVKGGR